MVTKSTPRAKVWFVGRLLPCGGLDPRTLSKDGGLRDSMLAGEFGYRFGPGLRLSQDGNDLLFRDHLFMVLPFFGWEVSTRTSRYLVAKDISLRFRIHISCPSSSKKPGKPSPRKGPFFYFDSDYNFRISNNRAVPPIPIAVLRGKPVEPAAQLPLL